MRRRLVAPERREEGSAVVEFLGVALLLMVPVVYLVVVMAQLQSAAFAVDGGAREAARAFVTAPDPIAAAAMATAAVGLALDDQGLDGHAAEQSLSLACTGDCGRGDEVTATVEVEVPLPGVPGWLQDRVPLAVPVRATATAAVDTFVAGP